MKNDLKFPIALEKITHELKDAIDVNTGLNCNCYCLMCDSNMVAVNAGTKQRPHFRHEVNSDCSGTYETYIHWLAKELFKEIKTLSLPDISFTQLDVDFRRKLFDLYDEFTLPIQFRTQLTEYLIRIINSKIKNINVDSVDIEKEFLSKSGNVRIDIVVNFGSNKLFIEPYFSNPISHDKLKILKEIDVSTISISLKEFINKKSHIFSKKDLKVFLFHNTMSKIWEHHKINPRNFIKILDDLRKDLNQNSETLKDYDEKYERLKNIDIEVNNLITEKERISNIIREKQKEKLLTIEYLDNLELS